MKRLWWSAAIVVLSGWVGGPGAALGDDRGEAVRREVLRMEERLRKAQLAGDVAFFEKTWAPEYIRTNARGETADRGRSLEALRAGLVRYEALEFLDDDVRVHGDTAVVSGRSRIRSVALGEVIQGDFRHTRVWVRDADGWKVLAFHSSRLGGD